MRSLINLVLLLAVSSNATSAFLTSKNAQELAQPKLQLIQKIHVGSMGDADEAERFRLLLEEQLAVRGFTVVDKPEAADAVLTGALSVRVQHEKSRARVYVKLSTPQGERLWGRDFGSRITSPFNRTEPVKLRAKDVADGLREEWEKAAKLNGGKANQTS